MWPNNVIKHLLYIHYDNVWSGSRDLFQSEKIGQDRFVPLPQGAILIVERGRYGAQLILEYGCQLQLSLLPNHKQPKEDYL